MGLTPGTIAALVIGTSFAAGLNVYATLLTLGGLARMGWVELPSGMEPVMSWWVMGASAALFLAEFVADKIPGFDLIWNAAQTFVRVPVAALLAYGATSQTRRIWMCYGCKKQFSLKVGTIFEDSPISLDKWMMAVWMISSCKNGVSSYEMARNVGVTQKSAWFMLHRIREAMKTCTFAKVDVEARVAFVRRNEDPPFAYPWNKTNGIETPRLAAGEEPANIKENGLGVILRENSIPYIATLADWEEFSNNRKDVLIFARATYKDSLGTKHWTNICGTFPRMNVTKLREPSHEKCILYNQEDHNNVVGRIPPITDTPVAVPEIVCTTPKK